MKKKSAAGKASSVTVSTLETVASIGDWRVATLAHVRRLIEQADPDVVEEVKWRKPSNDMRGVPVWSHDGIICTGETYKTRREADVCQRSFGRRSGRLFNASLEGNARRAIDLHEGDKLDEKAFKALIRAAVALNTSKPKAAKPAAAKPKSPRAARAAKPQAKPKKR
ncbi:MAG: DUF1801 domain-containing protein [Pirellulales bacterium]